MVTKKPQESGASSDTADETATGKASGATSSSTTTSASAKAGTASDAKAAAGDATMTNQADDTATAETAEAAAQAAAANELVTLKASRMIDRHMLAAAGVGIVPIPLVDLVGVAGVQLNMLRKLSDLYGVPFSANTGKNIIAALVGGAIPAYGAMPLFYLVRNIPVVGWTLGAGAASILAGASTYAVGHVLERHFAKGGSLEDLDVEEARSTFKDLMARGKERVAGLRKKKGDAAAAQTAEDVAAEAADLRGSGAAPAA